MDTRNGDLYKSIQAARAAGVPDDALIELRGDETAVKEAQRLIRDAIARERQQLAERDTPDGS